MMETVFRVVVAGLVEADPTDEVVEVASADEVTVDSDALKRVSERDTGSKERGTDVEEPNPEVTADEADESVVDASDED